jgi:hypothetical protein
LEENIRDRWRMVGRGNRMKEERGQLELQTKRDRRVR